MIPYVFLNIKMFYLLFVQLQPILLRFTVGECKHFVAKWKSKQPGDQTRTYINPTAVN